MKVQPTTQQLIAMLYERLPELFDRPQRKPLTDEEIEALLVNWPEDGIAFFDFARAIEAAHGIKGDA